MRVLLVEDDRLLGDAVHEHIADEGHAIDWVETIADAEAAIHSTPYDLLLLDLMLPDGPGLGLLRRLRSGGDVTPVIILTARDQISDRIAGLNSGADDYLVKPFNLSELSARLAAVSRRYAGNPNPLVTLGDIEFDLAGRSVYRSGRPVEVTAREWALLEGLLQHPGTLLSKTQLEERLYPFGAEVESNTIEVHISRLRKKLGHEAIETVRGMGYRLKR
ncbi:response regulator transcription factor [Afifella sp. JA880]|uniref:response regulator n=1 Tax=Afifella sp. JA880 TaxID=2975280 RepID=UPI0021BB17AB|nr:response regulator transcription factor [Afifella sp. JA880]MCT8268175.1 response regulator transcription factor [Afifella sp. JA880]